MKRKLLIVIIIVLICLLLCNKAWARETIHAQLNTTYYKAPKYLPSYIEIFKTHITAETEEVYQDPVIYYDIPLDDDLQKYIYEITEEYDMDYTVVLAIIWTENNSFDVNAMHKNSNGTVDMGLMQLNSKYKNWQAELAGINKCEFNAYNPHHNIQAGVGILNYYKEYWLNKGISEDQIFNHTVNSYNMGHAGFGKYVNKHKKTTRYYDQKVKECLKDLEQLKCE